MAFDGFVVSNLVHELNETLTNGRINKIYQPEHEEIVLHINNKRTTYKLLLSANATVPLVCLTNENKTNPQTPPGFCMLLRKHLNNARIIEVSQPSLERIIRIKIEHLDELGDLSYKYLIIEIMGRHSNVIFCNEDDMIIDSVKHISHAISSIREVLPGRPYFQPEQIKKLDPFLLDYKEFDQEVLESSKALFKAIYIHITGFSPLMANELCFRSNIDPSIPANELLEEDRIHLFDNFRDLVQQVIRKEYEPSIIFEGKGPIGFSCFKLSLYENFKMEEFSSISEVLETYYSAKLNSNTINQKSANLKRVVSSAIDRTAKKLDLQTKQYRDTQKRDQFRLYGELINTYGYNVNPHDKKFTALNYYNGEEVEIPLDPNLTMVENAQKYFTRYNKLKRTYQALTVKLRDTKEELDHLNSIKTSLDLADSEADLTEIREELMDFGYVKRRFHGKRKKKKKKDIKSQPYHYISSDGFHIYVGKNNYQNDNLTFSFASNKDLWFHTKDIPGSHVIVKTNGQEVPGTTYDEAARLAAYYSNARDSGKAWVDYTSKKHLNKPRGGKPGFAIYQTYKSVMASTDISDIKEVK